MKACGASECLDSLVALVKMCNATSLAALMTWCNTAPLAELVNECSDYLGSLVTLVEKCDTDKLAELVSFDQFDAQTFAQKLENNQSSNQFVNELIKQLINAETEDDFNAENVWKWIIDEWQVPGENIRNSQSNK